MIRAFFLLSLLFFAGTSEAREQPLNADEYCLALNLYYEARSEPVMGLMGVAYVTYNRSIHRKQSICHVVFAYKQFSWVHQYKVLDEHKHLKAEFRPKAKNRYWIICKILARTVIRHPEMDFTGGAEYFVAHYIYPRCLTRSCTWLAKMDFVGQYGNHLFYRDAKYRVT